LPYEQLGRDFKEIGPKLDAILVAEHANPDLLLTEDGLLPPERIAEINPAIHVGVIGGSVDADRCRKAGLFLYPEVIKPFGYMSYQSYHVGPRPVLELYAAGLKVGELMARARLSNLSCKEAAISVLMNSLAQDFQ